MTKCNESISINNNFEVVQMDGKVFFKAFPDFPIYDETWLPKCVWAQMDENAGGILHHVAAGLSGCR